jgi:deoxyribodipyrimidine photolyase
LEGAAVFEPWRFGGTKGYPQPIVEHGVARQRALKAFAK